MENKSTCHMTSERRLIDAEKFLQWVVKRFKCVPLVGSCDNDSEDMRSLLAQAPTVDAVEVVHGHWYKAPHHPYRCSNCGEMALLDMYGESHYRSNYCPNCGAKMDGDGNG